MSGNELRTLGQEELDLADKLERQGDISSKGKSELRMVWARQKAPHDYGALMFGIYVLLTFGSIVSTLAIFYHFPILVLLDNLVFGMAVGIISFLLLLYDKLELSFCDGPAKILQYNHLLLLDDDFHEDLTNLLCMFAIFLPLYVFSGHLLTGALLGIVIIVTANIMDDNCTFVLPCILEKMEKESYLRSIWARSGNREAD